MQRRRGAEVRDGDEESLFADTLLEYQWARDVAGLAASTLEKLVKPVIEVAGYYGLPAWRLTPRQVDMYFAGPGKRAHATVRQKLNRSTGTSRSWSSGTAVSWPAGSTSRRARITRDGG